MSLLSAFGCVFLSILAYLTVSVFIVGWYSLMSGEDPTDDLELSLVMAYIAGMLVFVAVMFCWADGIPCPFN